MDLPLRRRTRSPSKPPSSYHLSQSCAHLSDCMRSTAVPPMPFLRTQTIYTARIRARILESFSLRHAFLRSSLFVSHNTSEIDGSGNLSARGLNLEQIFTCRYRHHQHASKIIFKSAYDHGTNVCPPCAVRFQLLISHKKPVMILQHFIIR